MGTTFDKPSDLLDEVGAQLGVSDWLEITQQRIDQFAQATGDHQWIHVDADRAKAGPFGTTIAHGYLTLSLTNMFLPDIIEVTNISMGINYGVNKVRFPAPVPCGSRIRFSAVLQSAEEIPGGVQAVIAITAELEGSPKPACVVESVTRYLD